MNILITGVCGFVGSTIAQVLVEGYEGITVCGIDNLSRSGSERNRNVLRRFGVQLFYGDIRAASDVENLPPADWVIDAAANPSVLAGLTSGGSSRQLFEHNLASIVNVLEYCKRHRAGLVLLSSSRVYSIPALRALPLKSVANAFELDGEAVLPAGVSREGIGPEFSTAPPVSLYGSTKLAAEAVALEYGTAFDFPVWVDRCGVLAGAGQFGTGEQGIFSYWVNAHQKRRPLRYIGFDGAGKQVRDVFHPHDLVRLTHLQMHTGRTGGRRIYTAGGGPENAISLSQLTSWCDRRFGEHRPASDPGERPYDVPWIVMDNSSARTDFGWCPKLRVADILEEIAGHAEQHPDWLENIGV